MAGFIHTRCAVLSARAQVVAVVASALPQAAAIIARWSADDIPAQADNSALAGWTDSVGALAATQATPAAQPKYRTGGAGGKPYVLFGGAQVLDAGASNAVATACQSGINTSFVVYRNAQATSFGFLFTASSSTGYNLQANLTTAGLYGSGLQRVPYTGTGLSTIGYSAGKPDTTVGRVFINGTCINNQGVVKSTAGHAVCIGGSTATPSTDAKAEIYDVIVWNRALSASEMMQLEKWARDRYAAPYPWAGQPFRVFHGDSLTNGLAASAPLNSYPARVAAINGWPFGTWTNLGHVGAAVTSGSYVLDTEALSDVDPIQGIVGVPVHLAFFEWYNQRNQSAPSPSARTFAYCDNRRAAGGVTKLFLATSTDAADPVDNVAGRATYNADLVAGYAAHADMLVPVHTNTSIGVEGACPNAAPYTPNFNTDGIHMIDAGYNVLAGLMAPAMA